ncbi:uncharacterized protein LOC106074118 [Biomphalaria glabrata]|uniref:Uncharacterized protein LOC106074118 n=1 Tax=Biomphalaria glabrata TaxID=6526 RepID=A0A9W3B6U2_BIOGL|nr:uncharacterized protein LOC106074118 [Biomphalaria glabrata]XP_055895250.1 uncharacterized protein LOC106074118 [Biomphalaria glabrata]
MDRQLILVGDHETQESEGGEAELHKYLAGCKKNPGHRQFIPIDKFTLKHLPEDLQDKDLYEYTKVIADLTVRVDVKITSSERPKFWPYPYLTTQPYPFYNMRGRRHFKTGSGKMCYVNKFQSGEMINKDFAESKYTKCWCRKCQDSDTATNVWWEFYAHTATQLIFDDIEASHTTLRLFYDRDDSPVVSVAKVSVVDVNTQEDWCKLNCVTCDKNIGNKLMDIWKRYENVWRKVYNKYFYSRDQHKFTFIVSHPHGCSKQISVGQWMDKQMIGFSTRFTYTTCTCPGSSGAHVQCVGYNEGWCYHLVHSGSFKSGLNHSGHDWL